MPRAISFFVTFVLCASTSCQLPAIEKEAPVVNEVKIGSKFRIKLAEDHQDNTTWRLINNKNLSGLELLGSVWRGREKGVDFNLKALSSGQYTISFVKTNYRDTLEIKEFVVKIDNN